MGQKNALYFCAGLAIGILGTLGFLWFYQEPEAEAEPESEPAQPVDIPEPETEDQKPVMDGKSSIDDYQLLTDRVNYSMIAEKYAKTSPAEMPLTKDGVEPRRITEEEFEDGNIDGHYDVIGLTLYGNGVLADAISDEVMSESDAFVALGPNYTPRKLHEIFARALNYADDTDSIFIRNDRFFAQYEISYDKRSYQEVTGRYPDGSYGA